jgi:hypothetical protein
MSVVSGRRTRRTRRPEIDGSVLRWPGAASRFALFGEVMWTGVLMAIVSIAIITWPAAVAAGVSHLRRFLHAEASPPSEFFRDVRRSMPGALGVGVATLVLAAVLGLDLALASTGALPGGVAVWLTAAIVGVVVLTGAVMAAGMWTPSAKWHGLVRAVPRAVIADPLAAVMTITAIALTIVVAWQFLPLIVPGLGLLAFALVTLGERRK